MGAQCADGKIDSVAQKCKQRMLLQKVQRRRIPVHVCLWCEVKGYRGKRKAELRVFCLF